MEKTKPANSKPSPAPRTIPSKGPVPKPAPASASPPPSAPPAAPIASGDESQKLFRRIDWISFWVATLLTLAGYLYTVAPDLTLEDSGELAVGSMYAGVPHPPGYPVWTLYTWAFTKLLPFSNIAWRVAVSSAVAAAFACGICALIVSRGSSLLLEGIDWFKNIDRQWETRICLVSGLVSGMLLGFNGYIWSQAVIVEVYTLSVLSLMAMLACLFRWIYAPNRRRYLYWAFFWFGICLCNHQTLVVAAFGLVVLTVAADARVGRDMSTAAAGVWLLGLALYMGGGMTTFHESRMVFAIFNLIGIACAALAIWLHLGNPKSTDEWIRDGLVLAVAPGSLLFSLSLLQSKSPNQAFIAFLGVALALAVVAWTILYARKRRHLDPGMIVVLTAGLCYLAGAAWYFYMPLGSMSNPPMNWGYPRTWDGFIHAFTRGQYEKTNPTSDLFTFIRQVVMYAQGAAEEFNFSNLLVGLVPFLFWKRFARRERAWFIGLSAIYLCLALLLLVLLNPTPEKQTRELVKVFFTSSHVVVAMAIGYGLTLIAGCILCQYAQTRYWLLIGGACACAINLYDTYETFDATLFPLLRTASVLGLLVSGAFIALVLWQRQRAAIAPFLALFAIIPADSTLSHWADNEQRGHLFGFWFGHDMFDPTAIKDSAGKPLYGEMPRDSVLFGGTDPGRFCPTYMIFCESFIPAEQRRNPKFDRRDVALITQNALADLTYLNYIRAHYNRSAQIDPPFFQEMVRGEKNRTLGRTNLAMKLVEPLDDFFLGLGDRIEKRRQAGESLFEPDHFADFQSFLQKVRAGSDPLSRFLQQSLGDALSKGSAPDVCNALNKLIDGPSLFDPARFAGAPLSNRTLRFAAQNPTTHRRIRLNRILLEESFPGLIKVSPAGLYPDLEVLTPSAEDSNRCFNDYMIDAQRRMVSRQLKPGELVQQTPDGRVSVSGQVAVMSINALLCRVIFDKNPDNEFYIEESFPLDWMYPHLTPYGIIMKINREPVKELTQEILDRDHAFWSSYSERLIGNWINYETPVKEICNFARRVYQRHNFTGFKGDPKFIRDDNAQKSFSKLRGAIGGIYAWRLSQASGNERERLIRETDFAYKQSFAFCPYSPEAVIRYVTFLAQVGRMDDALEIAETCYSFDRDNDSIRGLTEQVRTLRASPNLAPPPITAIEKLENTFTLEPTNLEVGFQLASTYLAAGRQSDAFRVLDTLVTNPTANARTLLSVAEAYRTLSSVEKMETALLRYAPLMSNSPEAWYDLAGVQAVLGKSQEAASNATRAFTLSDARFATNPAAANLRAKFNTDARFGPVRDLPEFRALKP